jgi:hypothetical protein
MSAPAAPRSVVWAKVVAGAAIAMAVVGTVLLVLAGHLVDSAKDLSDQWFGGLGLLSVSLAIVGGLIAVRRPGNRIGWLLLASGAVYGLLQLVSGYAQGIQYAGWTGVPATWPIVWFAMSSWVLGLGAVAIFMLLLFPTGDLPSARWRPVLILSIGTVLVLWVVTSISDIPATTAALAGRGDQPAGAAWLNTAEGILTALAGVCMILAVVSLFVRYRRSAGVERQQLKWMAAGGILLAAGVVASFPSTWWSALMALAGFFAYILCIGVAILRYRLYDLGRIVSRVLAYGVITAVLVGVYAAIVVGLGTLFGRSGNPVLIAGATLLVAALFGPVRRRVQTAVDHRFNRRRYDAERALGAFAASLRDETALEQVRGQLLGTVRETVQPSTASVWLRMPEGAER